MVTLPLLLGRRLNRWLLIDFAGILQLSQDMVIIFRHPRHSEAMFFVEYREAADDSGGGQPSADAAPYNELKHCLSNNREKRSSHKRLTR